MEQQNQETDENLLQLSVIMLVKDEIDYLKNNVPRFIGKVKELIVMQDSRVDPAMKQEVHNIIKEIAKEKLNYYERDLNDNFGEQRNAAQQRARYPWVFHIDPDEYVDDKFWEAVPFLLLDADKRKFDVLGITRRNFIDDQRINPFETDPNANPDIQFRLLRRNVKWIGKVHEHPETLELNGNAVCGLPTDIALNHYKDSQRQKLQNEYYDQIVKRINPQAFDEKKPIKKIIANSVYQTNEGITKHFKEEIKEFLRHGYQVQMTELYHSHWDPTGELKNAYTTIDLAGEDYIYYCNQPPERPNNPERSVAGNLHHKNLISYVAFEGSKLPNNWVMILRHPNVKQVWCPSTYNKEVYTACGIPGSKIKVIPHGIDPTVYNKDVLPLESLQEAIKGKFVFLYVGTLHGASTKDRKGLDLLIEAFRNAFGTRDDVILITKINTIYAKLNNPNFNLDEEMKEYFKKGRINIAIIDENLNESQMASLYKSTNVFVSPVRAGGFEMPIIESMGVGTPVLVTGKSGHMDYCNEQNATLIKADYLEAAENRPPYNEGCLWFKPDINDLTEKLAWIKEHYEEAQKKAEIAYNEIHKNWKWSDTVNKMVEAIKEI